VGAAMAAGSQLLNGNCALLVKLPNTKNNTKINGIGNIFSTNVLFLISRDPNTTTRKPSPKRFVKAVFILALQEEEFWKKRTKKKEVTPKPSQPISREKILLPKMKKIIEEINIIVKSKKRNIRTSLLIYSFAKKKTEVTIIINVLKKTIDKKSIKNLISKFPINIKK